MTDRTAVRIERSGDGIAWLIMDRPDKRNAMNPAMHFEMNDALDELEADGSVDVVILTGAGEDSFCAGQDLKEFFRELADKPAEQARAVRASQSWRFERLTRFPKVTIAMVNGWCCGGAFTQLLACDLALAATDAQFSVSEVNWGIIPGGMVAKMLADAMRQRDAMYYILTAEKFDGKTALDLGLVNRAVPREVLREETLKLARLLQSKNQAAVRASKEAFRAVRSMDPIQAEEYLFAKVQALAASAQDGRKDGIDRFVDDKSYRPALESYTTAERAGQSA